MYRPRYDFSHIYFKNSTQKEYLKAVSKVREPVEQFRIFQYANWGKVQYIQDRDQHQDSLRLSISQAGNKR